MSRRKRTATSNGKAPLTAADAVVKAARIERSTKIAVAILQGLTAVAVAYIGAEMFDALR